VSINKRVTSLKLTLKNKTEMTKIGLSIFNVANYVQDMHRNIIRKK